MHEVFVHGCHTSESACLQCHLLTVLRNDSRTLQTSVDLRRRGVQDLFLASKIMQIFGLAYTRGVNFVYFRSFVGWKKKQYPLLSTILCSVVNINVRKSFAGRRNP